MAPMMYSPELQEDSDSDTVRSRFEAKVGELSKTIGTTRQSLTHTNDDADVTPPKHILADLVSDVHGLGLGGLVTIAKVFISAVTGKPWDDKQYLLEKLVKV